MTHWHTLDRPGLLDALKVPDARGLSNDEVARRLQRWGPNALVDRGAKSPWRIMAEQFASLLVGLLIVAAIVSGVILHEWTDAGVILVIVILNAALGFKQEYQAERAMAALKRLSTPKVRVRRDGTLVEVPSDSLVPGDCVHLEAGNLVPADARLIEVANLRVEEASLTGESLPVDKDPAPIADPGTPLGDRRNMLYLGTVVSYGRAVGLIVDTGMRTQLGHIAERLQSVKKEETPLQKQLARLGRVLVVVALGLIGVVALMGWLRGQPLRDVFLAAVSMAVAAVPEGLPAVVTIALALGAQRMLARRALVRKLPAVETLGSVSVICSDKTGTLTQNRMTVHTLELPEGRVDLTARRTAAAAADAAVPRLPLDHPGHDAAAAAAAAPPGTPGPLELGLAGAVVVVGGAVCNDAALQAPPEGVGHYHVLGDPTEGALLLAALEAELPPERLQALLPRVAEAPFDSERKRMTTVHRTPWEPSEALQRLLGLRTEFAQAPPPSPSPSESQDLPAPAAGGGYLLACKGAVDSVLEVCTHRLVGDAVVRLPAGVATELSSHNASLAAQGLRVLGVAYAARAEAPGTTLSAIEHDLTFAGMVCMVDPVRPEARDAVQTCVRAGIRPVMITGDHPEMARFIAHELGMLPAVGEGEDAGREADGDPTVLTGRQLAQMDDAQLAAQVETVSVYARVAPEHKQRIVDALQHHGHIVSMTGDGVNDAPALRSADIGVAMGITGTDVSREASDMVLQDDNFSTIVAAVAEGRTIYANVRSFVRYLLTCNAGELLVFLMAPLLGMPLPLLPVQILWMNLVTDGFPALGLGVEPSQAGVMLEPPRVKGASIVGLRTGLHIGWLGMLIAVGSLALGYWQWTLAGSPMGAMGGHAAEGHVASVWQTMLFCSVVFAQLFLALAERSDEHSLFTLGLMSNPYMLVAVGGTFLLQLGVVYVPFAQTFFKTTPLSLTQLGITIGAGFSVFVAAELAKLVRRAMGRRRGTVL